MKLIQRQGGTDMTINANFSKAVTIFVILFLIDGLANAGPTTTKRVYFINPTNNSVVGKKVTVKFGVDGMMVHPAGQLIENTGHHHLIIDGREYPMGTVIPNDKTNLHFGKGQTETEIELTPGKHTLTLQFADGVHKSFGPDMSSTITVEVK